MSPTNLPSRVKNDTMTDRHVSRRGRALRYVQGKFMPTLYHYPALGSRMRLPRRVGYGKIPAMAGETVKTTGIVIAVRPWSRTSHVVTWLTPDHGPVPTLVKGAVRPKSAFLGQYDLFYRCELLYYAHSSGGIHAIREAVPLDLREHLRGDWRATALAGYAADLAGELAPPDSDSAAWFEFLDRYLARPRPLVSLETGILRLAGLFPDLSGVDPSAPWTLFAIDRGRCGDGQRTVRLSPRTAAVLAAPDSSSITPEERKDAERFLGVFMAYHLERPAEIRRSLVQMLA